MAEDASEWDFSSRETEILLEIPKRLARLSPQLILLFGSRATGAARKDSDYDLLVVMDVRDPSQPRSSPVRRLLRGLGVPFDVVVYTPEEWSSYRSHPQSLAHELARAGRVLHESP
jgi:predicted nucleotidyltransferase